MQGMENSFSLIAMWHSMNWVAKGVVVVLALMSIWSLTIAIERLWRFQKAKHESLAVALGVTPLLKQHKLDEAIRFASDKKYRHSHLARVLRAGLTEFQYETSEQLPDDFDVVESGKRAIDRETLMTTAANPVPVKSVMNALGFPAGPFRLPLVPLTDEQLHSVMQVVKQAGDLITFKAVQEVA